LSKNAGSGSVLNQSGSTTLENQMTIDNQPPVTKTFKLNSARVDKE
jgi:hypothetical protein